MSLNVKVLGQGKIDHSAATTDLLTLYPTTNPAKSVPANKAIIVKAIRLVSSANRIATINYLASGENETTAKRAISPKNMTLPANALVVLDDELTMVAGDRLRADVNAGTSGDSVDFVISGVERDQT